MFSDTRSCWKGKKLKKKLKKKIKMERKEENLKNILFKLRLII
jgi:hypothetical protein